MHLIVVTCEEPGVRFFEKKRPGRRLPWRRRPVMGWRERGRQSRH
jgi:hypothetical protein